MTEQFLKDVSRHQMTIIKDDGLYRHIRFSNGSSVYHFNIITWPGSLCIHGDMGCYVFSRISDMFEFFRGHMINQPYWAEKVQAMDKNGGIKKYSRDRFTDQVNEWVDSYAESLSDDGREDEIEELRTAIKHEVLSRADDGEQDAMSAMIHFEHNGRLVFHDFWEADCRDYDYAYEWCCHAIQWAIALYDESKMSGAA